MDVLRSSLSPLLGGGRHRRNEVTYEGGWWFFRKSGGKDVWRLGFFPSSLAGEGCYARRIFTKFLISYKLAVRS